MIKLFSVKEISAAPLGDGSGGLWSQLVWSHPPSWCAGEAEERCSCLHRQAQAEPWRAAHAEGCVLQLVASGLCSAARSRPGLHVQTCQSSTWPRGPASSSRRARTSSSSSTSPSSPTRASTGRLPSRLCCSALMPLADLKALQDGPVRVQLQRAHVLPARRTESEVPNKGALAAR